MSEHRVNVRRATATDLPAMVETVVAAFAGDCAWDYILGASGLEVRQAFATALIAPRIEGGTAWVTDDCTARATGDRRSAEGTPSSTYRTAWATFEATADQVCRARLDAYTAAMAATAPPRPYWYLEVLATHPDLHGRGLATAVLEPGLTAAGRDGWGCRLETHSEANQRFYARRGFVDRTPFRVPDGPQFWWLGRPRPPDHRSRHHGWGAGRPIACRRFAEHAAARPSTLGATGSSGSNRGEAGHGHRAALPASPVAVRDRLALRGVDRLGPDRLVGVAVEH